MTVRPETPADRDAIESILRAAFAGHPHSQQTEHLIVNELRRAGGLAISLVAETRGEVVGHIAFSTVAIGGRECGWYALGPLAVRPEHQRRGIGRALVEEGLRALRALGARGCLLVGEPAYYTRFGFAHAPALFMEGIPPQYVLCLPLEGPAPRGGVTHHPAFSVTA